MDFSVALASPTAQALVAARIDACVGRIKVRRQGLSAGELVLSMAECMLGGGGFMCDLDHVRAYEADVGLRAVAEPLASRPLTPLIRQSPHASATDRHRERSWWPSVAVAY